MCCVGKQRGTKRRGYPTFVFYEEKHCGRDEGWWGNTLDD